MKIRDCQSSPAAKSWIKQVQTKTQEQTLKNQTCNRVLWIAWLGVGGLLSLRVWVFSDLISIYLRRRQSSPLHHRRRFKKPNFCKYYDIDFRKFESFERSQNDHDEGNGGKRDAKDKKKTDTTVLSFKCLFFLWENW